MNYDDVRNTGVMTQLVAVFGYAAAGLGWIVGNQVFDELAPVLYLGGAAGYAAGACTMAVGAILSILDIVDEEHFADAIVGGMMGLTYLSPLAIPIVWALQM